MQPFIKAIRITCMIFYIYTLTDPITNRIRYIGKTNNIRNRYNRHCSPESAINHRTVWLTYLKNNGKRPIMEILESFDNEDACYSAEVYWIAQFKAWGFDLVNFHEGGRSAYSNPMTSETKAKVSKALKSRYSNMEHHLKGRPQTEERRKLQSLISKNRKVLPSFKGRKHGPTVRKTVEVYKEGILIDTLSSVLEASIKYSVNAGAISNVCLGKSKTAKGYTFKYI